MGLLMLATLLVYAVPGHAGLVSHRHSAIPHEHVLADTHDAIAAVADHEHEQGPCKDFGLRDNGTCCSVAHCVTMHGGLLAAAFVPFVPHPDTSNRLPSLDTPEGIGLGPALRPPCLIL